MEVVEANGARIPAIGLGTMTLKDDGLRRSGQDRPAGWAIAISTPPSATATKNAVGEGLHQGLRDAGLKREDVFVTTKVY